MTLLPLKNISFLVLLILLSVNGASASDDVRQQWLLSGDEWQFLPVKINAALPEITSPEFTAGPWQTIAVPHTFQTRQHFNNPKQAWYRRNFTVAPALVGKRLYLVFEGAATVADVYVNQKHLGQHRGAYTRFIFDVTDAVKTGEENELAVRVDNDPKDFTDCLPDNSRLYKVWGGLYRKVWLLAVDPLHIDPTDYGSCGVYITPHNISEAHADLSVTVLLRNTSSLAQTANLKAILLDPNGVAIKTFVANADVSAGQRTSVEIHGGIDNPALWSPGKTNLYHLRTEVWRDGALVDAVIQPVGFRNLIFDKASGRVSLNGRPIILLGANLHQEIESKASAMADDDFRENYAFMQDLGFNFIRLPHYPHAQLEYDLCDRLGIFCWAENGHSNQDKPGPTADRITTEMVKQNYNHPSIAVWSVGNEAGEEVADREVPVVKALDSTRPVVVANMKCTNADFHGINAYPAWYQPADVWKFPDHGYVTETGGGGVTTIHCDYADTRFKFNRYEPEEYQQLLAEARFQKCVRENDGSLGMFAWWCLRDLNDVKYKSPIGWNTKGLVTYAGFKKDIYYLYRCFLRPQTPTVHIASQEYFIRTGRVDNGIKAYASASRLTLILNGDKVSTLTNGQYALPDGHRVNNVFYWPAPLHTGKNVVSVADPAGNSDSAVIYFYGTNGLPEIPPAHPLVTELHSSNSNNPAYFMDMPVQAQWPIYYDLDSTADNSFDRLPPAINGARWIALRRVTKPGQETGLSFKLTRPATIFIMATAGTQPPSALVGAGFEKVSSPGLVWRDNKLMLIPAELFSRSAQAGETIDVPPMGRDAIVLVKEGASHTVFNMVGTTSWSSASARAAGEFSVNDGAPVGKRRTTGRSSLPGQTQGRYQDAPDERDLAAK
jgi:beta-galactosidase